MAIPLKIKPTKIDDYFEVMSKAIFQAGLSWTAIDKRWISTGFANYLHAFKDYDTLASDLKRRFKYLGDMNVYYFLFRTGEPVPPFKKWIKTIPGDHPRMKEMIEAADINECNDDFGDAINKHG